MRGNPKPVSSAGRDAIEKLKADARKKRDQVIRQAKDEYSATLKALRLVKRKLRAPTQRLHQKAITGDLTGLSSMAAAEAVLTELGPLSLEELAAQIQARGCRSGDEPRKLIENLRNGFKYHAKRGRFVRGEDGRWGVG